MQRLIGAMAAAVLVAAVLGFPATAFAGSSTTSCTGSLPPGTYGMITVPAGATCDLGAGPVIVLGGVRVSPGASFLLGVEYTGPASGTINGGIVANGAAQVVVYNALIHGAVSVQGGAGPFGCAGPVPGLCYTDLSDDTITGGVTVNGYDGIWLGFIRDHVNGTVMLTNNVQSFDEIDVGSNVVNGSLLCSGNVPLENTGVSPGGPSTVTGQDTCNGT